MPRGQVWPTAVFLLTARLSWDDLPIYGRQVHCRPDRLSHVGRRINLEVVVNAELPIPSHVAPALVFDFDLYADRRYGEKVHTSLDAIQHEAPDVFWTPRNGGHWVVTRHELIQEVVQDPEHFSARESRIPRIPNPPKLLPLNLDPPENVPYRQALMPAFSPKAVKALEEKIRHWAREIVNEVADKGRCDFVGDVSGVFRSAFSWS